MNSPKFNNNGRRKTAMWSGLSSEKMNHANLDLREAGFNSQASESLSNDDQDGEEEFDPNKMEEQVSGLIMGF